MVHYRLVVPVKRSRHPPEHTARGVGIGLFWAFTPLVGVQMGLCLLTWLAVRRFPSVSFNLLVAIAWTWVTNALTMWPLYYAFYVTGKLLRGEWRGQLGYSYVVDQLKAAFASGDDLASGLIASGEALLRDEGLAMALGSVPYAILLGWLGYRWSLAYLQQRQRRRDRRSVALATGQALARARSQPTEIGKAPPGENA